MKKITDKEYRDIDAISQSEIKAWLRSPAYWQAVAREPQAPTQAMILGSYFDALVTRDRIDEFAVNQFDGRTKEGKAFAEANSDKTIISARDANDVARWYESLLLSDAKSIIETCETQVSIIQTINDILCKGRLDLISVNTKQIYDIKLLSDASPRAVARSLSDGYDIQAAMYCALAAKATQTEMRDWSFTLICQEKHPFRATGGFTGIYSIAQADILTAYDQICVTINEIVDAKQIGAPGYPATTLTSLYSRQIVRYE